MNKFGHVTGRVLFMTVVAAATYAPCATASEREAVPGTVAAQMLASATRELANGQLSATDRARNLVRRGLAHEMLGERADAVADFSTAISASVLNANEQASALFDRGVTLDELGRTGDAIADYTAALQLQPKLAAALNNRANALRRLGRLDEARRDYEASMSAGNQQPEYPEYGMGQIAEALGQPGAAVEYYRSALAANPGFTLAEERLVAMDAGSNQAATAVAAPQRPARHGNSRRRHSAPQPGADTQPALKPTISDFPESEGHSVQLGAYRSQAEATDAWDHAQKRAGELLTGLTPSIIAVDFPVKGRYYRLRIGQPDAAAAAHLCALLRAKGTGCILASD